MTAIPARWSTLKPHAEQIRLWTSRTRFCVVPAGRRSGKTEIAKRRLITAAISYDRSDTGLFVAAAPTQGQAKRIFWDDLKRMTPPNWIVRIAESDPQTIFLVNGARIMVSGMDQPARIEGDPLDGIVLDEYGNMKAKVWTENVRPALSTLGRPGWAWFTGVPEGRNHYYDLAQMAKDPTREDWDLFHWVSADILDPAEIASARRDLDELTFQQEYEASFVVFAGQAYYAFDEDVHAAERLEYDPRLPLVFCFDFNVSPGVAVVCQEQRYTGSRAGVEDWITAVIGEVWIPRNSNTLAVCRKLADAWGHHEGDVYLYGDPTGGNRGSAKLSGSDWTIIEEFLGGVFPGRIRSRVKRKDTFERQRINATNSRLKTTDGTIRMLVDRSKAPHVVRDYLEVCVLEGGCGEIDKHAKADLTHVSDALGYYLALEFPIQVEGHAGAFYV